MRRLSVLILVIMFFQNVFATQYYVSVSGSDKNNGLTEKTAWRTITYAATKAVAGDIVWIKAGDYGKEYVVVRNNGTQAKPIQFIGYKNSTGDIKSLYFSYSKGKTFDSREMPLLDGKNRGQGTGFNLEGKSYIQIKNLQVTNYNELVGGTGSDNSLIERLIAANAGVTDATAVNFDGTGNHHNVLRNCIVMNATDRAIAIGGNNNLVENCKTYADQDDIGSQRRSMDYHVFVTGSNNIIRGHYAEHVGNLKHTGHGLVLKGNGIRTENNLIEDCDVVNINGSVEFRHRTVKYNTARNIRIRGINSSDPGGFHFRDGAGFNIVENCTVKNIKGNNGAISFYDSVEDGGKQWAANDNIIRNCIIENCDLGINMGTDSKQTYSTIYNNKIMNCTFVNLKDLFLVFPTSTNKNNVIENSNISNVNSLFYRNYNSPAWIQSYNNYFNNGFEKPAGTGNITADPQFEDLAKGNYRLKSTSKLIDAGKKVENVKTDFDSKKRPSGSSHDIGAYEYQGGGTSSTIKADAGKDMVICKGNSTTLTASGGSVYKWSTGATTKSITVNPDATTTYSVTVSEGSNSDTDEVLVTVNELPKAGAGSDVTIDAGQSVTLTATGGDTYLWSNGATTASIKVSPTATTTYEVTVTKGGCSATDKVKVTVISKIAPPAVTVTADAGKNQTICSGNSTTLTASGGSVYKWSTGATTKSITVKPNATTTYSVTVSEGTVSDTDEVVVTVNEIPKAAAGSDVTIEAGQSATLTATGGDTYLWSNGATTASIKVSPTATTTYEVTVTKGGCSATDKVKVTVISKTAPPAVTVTADAGKNQTICSGNSTTLTASGGSTYKWSTGETTKSITVKPSATTTYSVTVSEGTVSDTDEVVVTVNEIPKAAAGSDVTIEAGQSTTLTATGGDTYLWSNGATTASIKVSPTDTTTYEVTVTKGGCSASDSVVVTVNGTVPPSTVTADAGKDQTICSGNSTTLTASGGSVYKWSTGATTKSITVSPGATTTYSVTVSEGSVSDTDEVVVTVNEVPDAAAGSDVTIEVGQSTTLTATGGDTYLWSNGATTADITVSPTATTTYEVAVSRNGCSSKDAVTVSVNAVPAPPVTVIADAGMDQTICSGNSTTLTASGGSVYKWSTGESTNSITVNPGATTTYSVTVSEGSVSDTDEVVVTVNEIPKAAAGSDVTIEAGQSTTLTATGGDTYLWSNGATTASIKVSPTATTTYEVTVTKGGCSASDSVVVTVNGTVPPSTVTADAGKDQTICNGNSTTLTASGGSVYKWSTGETTNSITVNPGATTTYSVTVSEGSVSDTDEVVVTVNEVPDAAAGSDVTIESGQSTTLTATGGDTYLWSNGATTADITVSPTATTTYEVIVSRNGCSSKDAVTVSVDAAPAPPVTVIADAGNDQSICTGSSATLTASGGSIYKWSTGETTKSITVNPDATTTYIVKVSEGSGSDTDEVVVTVNPLPVADAGTHQTIVKGESVQLTATGGDTYLWSTGETTQRITVKPEDSTIYSVTVSQNGCSSVDSVQVFVVEPPALADAGNDLTICLGEQITLTGSGGTTYSWSSGESSQNITVSPTRTSSYTLTANRGGTTSIDEIIVTVINCDLGNGVNTNPTGTSEPEEDTDTDTTSGAEEQLINKELFELTVYPNPTEGQINVQTNIPIYNFNLVLMNINGHVIYTDEMDAKEDGISKQIDLSRFAKGVYLLQLYNDDISFLKKVIVI